MADISDGPISKFKSLEIEIICINYGCAVEIYDFVTKNSGHVRSSPGGAWFTTHHNLPLPSHTEPVASSALTLLDGWQKGHPA